MKNFIIATLIFIAGSVASMALAVAGMYFMWETMPTIFVYSFGWLAAGVYVFVVDKKKAIKIVEITKYEENK